MKKKIIILALVGLVVALLFAFLAINQFIYQQKQGNGLPVEPYQATLTGEFSCLPHNDTSGPVTLECAFGIKTESGEYYALDFGENESADQFRAGETATLTGTITPIENLSTDYWQKYDIVGIFSVDKENANDVTNFEECVKAGNPVMESYPRQCIANGENFTEDIGNINEKSDLITVDTPRPNAIIISPLNIQGQARGTWFFEGSFPVVLTDWDGKIIAEGVAAAQSDWMTDEFVGYKASLTFTNPSWNADFSKSGSLILRKDNPSGLPKNDDALEIPVRFE